MKQFSWFDGSEEFKINKPIRLIELFAGYGSQSLSMRYMGIPYESWRISEWAVNSILAYKDLHHPNDNTDYSEGMTDAEVKEQLRGKISIDYSNPIPDKQLERMSGKRAREIWNSAVASRNLLSITSVKGEDLCIDDEHCYIMTYSFPCQDLSIAGEQAGMARGSGTRSGLLWEVERILNECKVKPQVLLMENVPNLLSEAHRGDFGEWVRTLDAMGYVSEWEVLNSADFGIPQNRQRVFMVSIQGDYFYEFPAKTGRSYKLLDFCDDRADEKYYIKKSNVEYVEKGKTSESGIEILNAEVDGTSRTIKAHIGQTSMANFVRSDSFGATGVREWCSQNVNVEREVSKAVRKGGRGSLDRHSWDIVSERNTEDEGH